jgi:hypothetical protein
MADILDRVGIKSSSLNTYKALTRHKGPNPSVEVLSPSHRKRLAFRQAIWALKIGSVLSLDA